MSRFLPFAVILLAIPVAAAPVPKGPPPPAAWPMLGGTPERNMVNLKERLAAVPREGPDWDNADAVGRWEAEWVRWSAWRRRG